jgi:hypothetical protein
MNETIPFRSKNGRVGRMAVAPVAINEDAEAFRLQIELENDMAVVLIYWEKRRQAERVTVAWQR